MPGAGSRDAHELFSRGASAYQAGDYEAAIRDWTQAYALDPRPLIQYNLSQAYERSGRIEDAAAALDVYLAHAEPNDPNQTEARARLRAAHDQIQRTGLHITGGPDGATILIDDHDHGRTPQPEPIHVAPGSHRILVQAAGCADYHAGVSVPAGGVTDVRLQMTCGQGGTLVMHEAQPDILPPVLLAGGGALVTVVGLVVGGVALGNANGAPSADGAQANSARGLALGADICIWTGLAAAIAGGIWLAVTLWSSRPSEGLRAARDSDLHVAPFIGAHEAGATALLEF